MLRGLGDRLNPAEGNLQPGDDLLQLVDGLCGGPLLDGGLQVGQVVVAAVHIRDEPGIGDQILPAHGAAQVGIHLVGAAAHDEVAVLGPERVKGGNGGVLVASPMGGLAGDGVLHHEVLHHGEQGVHHGDVDPAAHAGLLPLIQGHQDAHAEIGAGVVVADGGTNLARGAVPEAGDAHHAAHGLGHDVVGGAGGQLAGEAEAADGAVDDAGVDLLHLLIGEAQTLQHAHLVVLANHVGGLQQLGEDLLALFALQVQGHALLVAVDVGVVAAEAVLHGAPAAGLITGGRGLDLDDLGAVVGQVHGAERAAVCLSQVQYANAFQRSVHKRFPFFL